jgi:putative nucleotidyltransferase with HDIG domain
MEINEEMIKVPIIRFFSGLTANVDIFISLAPNKYILLFREGSTIELEQLKKYKDQKIDDLYIRKKDYPSLVKNQIKVADVVIESHEVPSLTKVSVFNKVAESVFDEFQQMGFEQEAFHSAQEVSKSVISLVNSKIPLANLLDSFSKISSELFRHSMAVSFLAPMIGIAMQWTRRETLEKLSLGGMLHDIGKKEMPPELLTKTRAEMTYEEIKEYESHPFRGMQLLATLQVVPEDVIAMVYEHHENSIGQGYPRRLWDMKLNPMSRVIAIANCFCELSFGSTNYPGKKTPEEALVYIEQVLGQPFNKQVFKALKAVVEKQA